MMKGHVNGCYTAMRLSGNGGLVTYPPYDESIEGIRTLIDEANKRAVERGYRAEAFLICRKETSSFYDENDQFVISSQHIYALDKYPANP